MIHSFIAVCVGLFMHVNGIWFHSSRKQSCGKEREYRSFCTVRNGPQTLDDEMRFSSVIGIKAICWQAYVGDKEK